jgi:hypothetical protein
MDMDTDTDIEMDMGMFIFVSPSISCYLGAKVCNRFLKPLRSCKRVF